jgi:hypothetical protein
MTLVVVALLTNLQATAQTSPASPSASTGALVESYKVAETTIEKFFADGWSAGDIFRGKPGILAYRYAADDQTFSLILGVCEGLAPSPTAASGMDMSMQILKVTGKSFATNWANEMDITIPTGDGVRCTKTHRLKFVSSKLAVLQDLRIAQ